MDKLFKNIKFQNTMFFFATLTSVIYLVWRAVFTLPFNQGIIAAIFGVMLLISEITSALGTYELYYRKNRSNKVDLALPVIPHSWYPDVDVIVATHNEPVELVYKTVNALTYLDYPDKNKVHIYIADDGNRPAMAKLAQQLGVGYFPLANNKEAKSGNLNNALKQTNSPLVATFDADMIARKEFLMETVPYFFLPRIRHEKGEWLIRKPEEIDPNFKIGFIQTPQSFYNPDLFQFNLYSEQNIPNEQDFFSREINVMRNSSNAVAYTGSNTVISRQALVEIGGFPTDTITEDFETGIKIQSKGYTTYSTLTPMASGLAPTSIKSMVTQRIRWARGVVQSIRNTKILTNKGLSRGARISYLLSYSYWWSFGRRLVFTLAPIMFALFNQQVVNTTFWEIVMIWGPQYIFYTIATRCLSSDTRNQRWNQIIDTILAPFMMIPVFLETIGLKQLKFKVTEKSGSKPQNSNLVYIIPQLVMLGMSIAGLIRYLGGKYGMALFFSSFIAFWLIINITNLLYAVYFMMGRKAYRSSERFVAEIPVTMSYGGKHFSAKTKNISEGGFLFSMEHPSYLPEDAPLEFTLKDRTYTARVRGKIVYIDSAENRWLYHVQLLPGMSEHDTREYLQMIYDREHSLPKSMNIWVTSFDDLVTNASKRLETQRSEMRALPRIQLERTVRFEEGITAKLVDFNFKFVLLRGMSEYAETLTLAPRSGVRMELEDSKKNLTTPGVRLYRVVNWEELSNSKAFQTLLEDWIFEYNQGTLKPRKTRKRAAM